MGAPDFSVGECSGGEAVAVVEPEEVVIVAGLGIDAVDPRTPSGAAGDASSANIEAVGHYRGHNLRHAR